MTAGVVLAAGGKGTRLGARVPKAWVRLDGVPLFVHALGAFQGLPWVKRIVVVMEPKWVARTRALVRAAGFAKVAAVVPGGARRQDSVARGVRALRRGGLGVVLVHDAARPVVDAGVAARVAREAFRHGVALAALSVADTVKREGRNGLVAATVARGNLWLAQTPQAVRADLVPRWLKALDGGEVTDDVQPLETMGLRVKLVPGSRRMAKVTVREDLDAAEALLSRSEIRAGLGFDLHRLVPGRPLVLGGVRIPFPRGLEGHSDADLISHALTDALLGATGGGDIGTRFGVRRKATRNARSLEFVHEVVHEAMHRGFAVRSADVTLLAEAPRLGPWRARILRNLAEVLHLGPDRVSLKATTFKRTGAIGRGEALACLALVSVKGPAVR